MGTPPQNMATYSKEGHHQGACTQVCLPWGIMENKEHLYYMKEIHLLTIEHLPNGWGRDSGKQLKLWDQRHHGVPFFAFTLHLDSTSENTVQALKLACQCCHSVSQPAGPHQLQASCQVSSPTVHTRTPQLVPIQTPAVLLRWPKHSAPQDPHWPKLTPAHLSQSPGPQSLHKVYS